MQAGRELKLFGVCWWLLSQGGRAVQRVLEQRGLGLVDEEAFLAV